MLLQLSLAYTTLLLLCNVQGQQRGSGSNRRQEVIDEWIRTIREAPKGHSISPSWTSKARPQIIGVHALPLQNEAVPSAAEGNLPGRSKPNQFNAPPAQKQQFFNRPKRLPQDEGQSRPRETFNQNLHNNAPSLTRYHEIPEVSSFQRPPSSQQRQEFRPLRGEKRPGARPERQQPQFTSRPEFRPFSEQSERPSFQFEQNKAPFEATSFPERGPESFPSIKPFGPDEFGFDFSTPTQGRNSRPKKRIERPFFNEPPGFNDEIPITFLEDTPPPLKRPKRKRPSFSTNQPLFNRPSRRFPQQERPTQFVDYRSQNYKPARPFNLRREDDFEESRVRTTTPRPIPTPGPNDFPRPPPAIARPPPTHPTHPPLPTHSPDIYDSVTARPALNEVEDYDYKDANEEDDKSGGGFFEYPGSFPNLEDLGAGFESMKIRNRRSTDEVLATSEARIRPRMRLRRRFNPAPENNQGRYRRNQARQGFGFQQNFWDDANIDSNDFFSGFGGDRANTNLGIRSERYTVPDYYPQSQSRGRDPYTEQTIQSYPADNEYYNNEYSGYGNTAAVVNNEILGSGNFEVIKGGTFYDDDTYYYSTYNRRPQYGEQLFENFRDFADIKNDLYTYPRY